MYAQYSFGGAKVVPADVVPTVRIIRVTRAGVKATQLQLEPSMAHDGRKVDLHAATSGLSNLLTQLAPRRI